MKSYVIGLYTEKIAKFLAQMLLLNVFTFLLREFTSSTPPYATLSDFTEQIEASFEGSAYMQKGKGKERLTMIQRACGEARNAGSEWLWNFAACVDKRSSAAQSEAINSLAKIYRDCEYSIIYLADFDFKLVRDETMGGALAECRWVKNIWAIPQIIFAREAYFYSSDWSQIGTKRTILPLLSSIMGIDKPVLEDSDTVEDYSIARRMSWASDKTALRIEDYAYALLGLFNVSMPIIYGEGRRSFIKLQEEIIKDTDDFSLFAWDNPDVQQYTGLFAHSPAWFRRFRNGPKTPMRINGDLQIHCAGITIETSLYTAQDGSFLSLENQEGSNCCIPLSQWNGCYVRKGSQLEWDLPKSMSLERRRVCIKRDVTARVSRKISGPERVVRVDEPQCLEPTGIGPARGSSSPVMAYNSDDRMGSEDRGLTSQTAPAVSLGAATIHASHIVGEAQEGSSVRSTLSDLGSDVRLLSVHAIASEAQSLPEDCGVGDAENDSLCSDSASANGDSGTHDLVDSDGISPTANQILDVAQISKELGDIVAEEFLSSRHRSPAKRSLVPWLGQTRKRPRIIKSFDHLGVVHTSESDDGETVVVKKARFFACPFYIRNKRYTKCITRNHLLSIEDVKDHLLGEHRQPVFCPLCKEEFPLYRTRDAHLRLRSCHLNDLSIPEGITNDQDDKLNWEEESDLPDELHWFQVWDIIFPHIPHPPSAFYTGERELGVFSFRQFWIQSGEGIIAAFLQEKHCWSYSIQNEESKLQAIYDVVMDNVVDRIFVDFTN